MKVSYSVGRTLNMRNFESAKFEIGVEVSCPEDELDETYEKAKQFVDEQIAEEEKNWKIFRQKSVG